MSLTIPQHFDVNHRPIENVFFYYNASDFSKVTKLPGAIPDRNFANEKHKIGNFASIHLGSADQTKPFVITMNGTGVDATGEKFEILPIGAPALEACFFAVSGIYNTAAGLFFRFGPETPKLGESSILFDSTNVTITQDDGTVSVAPHGETWLNGDRFFIGVRFSYSSPLIYISTGKNDIIAEALAGFTLATAPFTMADSFLFGVNGNPVFLTAALIARIPLEDIKMQKLYDLWRVGNFVLHDALNELNYT